MEIKELVRNWNTPREQLKDTIPHDIKIVLLESPDYPSHLRHIRIVHNVTRWSDIEENGIIVKNIVIDLNSPILLLVLEVICLIEIDVGHGSNQIPVSDDVKLDVLKSVNVAIQFILYSHLHFLKSLIFGLQYIFALEV